jgi:hypothetical protein
MKRAVLFTLPALALVAASCATPKLQASAVQAAPWLQDIQDKSRLVAEVHALRAVDQFERNKIVALLNDQSIPAAEKDVRVKELGDMITRNDGVRMQRLKEIFQTIDLVKMAQLDEGMARSAFMIIRHAENDLAFQKSQMPAVLELVKKSVFGNQEYSTFVDKIAVGEGKPQVYGTQGKCENNVWQVVGPHNRTAIVAARTEIGLEPLDDYMKRTGEFYGCGTG